MASCLHLRDPDLTFRLIDLLEKLRTKFRSLTPLIQAAGKRVSCAPLLPGFPSV